MEHGSATPAEDPTRARLVRLDAHQRRLGPGSGGAGGEGINTVRAAAHGGTDGGS